MVASSSNLLSSVVATLVSWIISVFGITFASMGTLSIRTFCRNGLPILLRFSINHALQQTESCLLVLTTDQSLLSANPQNAWQQPPVLSLHAVTK